MFVGNGHDRSGIVTVTAILIKIIIEYNIQHFEPEHSLVFPTTSLQILVYYKIRLLLKTQNLKLKTLNSFYMLNQSSAAPNNITVGDVKVACVPRVGNVAAR